jgi:hypothetical protein
METVKTQLKKLNVVVERESPWSPVEDSSLYLGGQYDGIHISIGQGYYSVVRECENGALKFICGKGNIEAELKKALADN